MGACVTQIIGSCNPDIHSTIQKTTRNLPILKWTATVEGSFKVLFLAHLLTIADSEIGNKNREEDLKQTRGDRPIFKKKVGTYNKCEFSNFFLFQRAKMIISVLVTWMTVDCNLSVRVYYPFSCALQINSKRPIFDSLADTEFRSGKIRKF